MLYAIKIDSEEFDLNKKGEIERMFSYCEKRFKLYGQSWEEIKEDYDYELLGELIESLGSKYEEYIE